MRDCAAVILAAGLGTRMKSKKVKVLHEIAGLPMVCYSARTAAKLNLAPITVVVGHQGDEVEQALREFLPKTDIRFVTQREQKGTGHALKMARKELKNFKGDLLILYGDVPLLSAETVRSFRRFHEKSEAVLSVLTMMPEDLTGYGRMVLDENRDVVKIVEHKDATPAQRTISEVNTGIYIGDCQAILKSLARLKADNAQGEFYLTDVVGMIAKKQKVSAILTDDPMELIGVNDRSDLALVTALLHEMIAEYWMRSGVTLIDPATTYIDAQAIIDSDTEIGPGVIIKGRSKIGSDCIVEKGAYIRDGQVASGVHILPYSVIEESKISEGCQIGPFARIRPGTSVGPECKVGNFVELKKVKTGKNTKVSHLTYLGDAELGNDINIGAGTITCNYDGVAKHKTVIGDGAFIGSDSQLIAPIKVGKGAYIGSGSTVTKDVPDDALTVIRGRELTRKGYAKVLLKQYQDQKDAKAKAKSPKRKKRRIVKK